MAGCKQDWQYKRSGQTWEALVRWRILSEPEQIPSIFSSSSIFCNFVLIIFLDFVFFKCYNDKYSSYVAVV